MSVPTDNTKIRMGKSRAELVKELEKLDTKNEFEVKEDHNVSDIQAFIELLNLREANQNQQTEIEELTLLNKELNDALAEATNRGTGTPTVTIKGGKKLEVVHSVNLEGKSYSQQKIAEDKAVAAKLFEMGSTAVRQIK